MTAYPTTIPGVPELTEAMYGAAPSYADAEFAHAYRVVGEMLEHFGGYSLATWAPVAAIIMRERNAARVTPYEQEQAV